MAGIAIRRALPGPAIGGSKRGVLDRRDGEVDLFAGLFSGMELLQERNAPLASGPGAKAVCELAGDRRILTVEERPDFSKADSKAEADLVVRIHVLKSPCDRKGSASLSTWTAGSGFRAGSIGRRRVGVRDLGGESLEIEAPEELGHRPEVRGIVERAGFHPRGIESNPRNEDAVESGDVIIHVRISSTSRPSIRSRGNHEFERLADCGGVFDVPRLEVHECLIGRDGLCTFDRDGPGDPFAELAIPGGDPFLQPSFISNSILFGRGVGEDGKSGGFKLGFEIGSNGGGQAGGAEVGCGDRSGSGRGARCCSGTPGGRERFFELGDASEGRLECRLKIANLSGESLVLAGEIGFRSLGLPGGRQRHECQDGNDRGGRSAA